MKDHNQSESEDNYLSLSVVLLRAGAAAPTCLFENNEEKSIWPWRRFGKAYLYLQDYASHLHAFFTKW